MSIGQIGRINRLLRRTGWRELSIDEIDTVERMGLDVCYGEYALAALIVRDRQRVT